MKKCISLALALFIVVTVYAAKKAFIVTISDFLNNYNYRHVSSSNDLLLLRETLQNQKFDTIIVVAETQATKKGIVTALEDFIANVVQQGDVIYLHFSTHGIQIQDFNGDEIDGFDESIVAYDSEVKFVSEPEKTVASFLTDDELGVFMERIRAKLTATGDLIVAIDACHSGTGSRGDDIIRGGYAPLTIPGYRAPEKIDVNNYNELSTVDEANKASYVVFSASQADLPNRELKIPKIGGIGSLSYAMCTALSCLPKDTAFTYRKLYEDIKIAMSSLEKSQLPAIEGSGIDRGLFAGNYVFQEKYFRVDSVTKNKIIIEAGSMNKVYEGTKVAICGSGATGPADKRIVTGTVGRVDNFHAEVDLDTALNVPLNAWVFITKMSFGKREVRMDISALSKQNQAWVSNIAWNDKAPFVKLTHDTPDVILKETANPEDAVFDLFFPDGYYKDLLSVTPINRSPVKDAFDLVLELSNLLQYKILSKMDLKDSLINIEIRMYPKKPGTTGTNPDDTCMSCLEKQTVNGTLYITEGDTVMIYAVNKGIRNAYFNVLDFEPYGKINMIFPVFGTDTIDPENDLLVKKDKKFSDVVKPILYPVVINKPYGNEIFKVIVSENPLDLRPIFEATQRGEDYNAKGSLSVLEEFVLNAVGTRKGEPLLPVNTLKSNGSTSVFNFVIQPKPADTVKN